MPIGTLKMTIVVEEQTVSVRENVVMRDSRRQAVSGSLSSTRNGVSPGRHGHGQWPPYLTMVMVVIINISIALINIIMALKPEGTQEWS